MLVLNCQCKNKCQFMFPLRPQKGAGSWLKLQKPSYQNKMDHIHLQASTPYRVLLSFQFWIATPKGKFYMVKNFWLNIWMISSKCSINQLFNLIFIKVSVKKTLFILYWTIHLHHSKFKWFDVLMDFCSKIQD